MHTHSSVPTDLGQNFMFEKTFSSNVLLRVNMTRTLIIVFYKLHLFSRLFHGDCNTV